MENVMAEYFTLAAPVTLTVTLTVTKATANGKLAISDAVVASVDGKKDDRFYAFAGRFGDLVLNFKPDGRPQKPAPKAVPAALTTAQLASIPGPATKPVAGKGKAKVAEPAPAAPAEPDMAAIIAAVLAAMGQK
jgi:hypothetical protein